MPLILVTGLPCSGKSSMSQKIFDFFDHKLKQENDSRLVKVVTDEEQLDWDGRDCVYMSIAKEKELRGWLRAETQRFLNLNQIVILDSAAYIKGFRYELFCMSKEAKTQYCIVERLIDPEVCWKWNVDKLHQNSNTTPIDEDTPAPGYKRETFDALILRYEKCDESNRWDSPLFRMTSENEELDLEHLYRVIIHQEPLKPNKCTALKPT